MPSLTRWRSQTYTARNLILGVWSHKEVLRDLTATGQETADEAKEEEDEEAFCDEAFLELERKTNQD